MARVGGRHWGGAIVLAIAITSCCAGGGDAASTGRPVTIEVPTDVAADPSCAQDL